MAKLHFKYGAMNSGKSTVLINTAFNYNERGLEVVTMKSETDTKGEEFIIARAGLKRAVDILAEPELDVREAVQQHMAKKALQQLHCVLVDEAQFMQPRQIDQLLEVAKLDDISVIAYGLRADFLTHLFPGSKRLLEIADNIEKLPTMCRCDRQAEFNCRKINDIYVFEGDQVAVDGHDGEQGIITYDSLCFNCYNDEKTAAEAEITTS